MGEDVQDRESRRKRLEQWVRMCRIESEEESGAAVTPPRETARRKRHTVAFLIFHLVVGSVNLFLTIWHLQYLHPVNDSYHRSIRKGCFFFTIRVQILDGSVWEDYLLSTGWERLLLLFTTEEIKEYVLTNRHSE